MVALGAMTHDTGTRGHELCCIQSPTTMTGHLPLVSYLLGKTKGKASLCPAF